MPEDANCISYLTLQLTLDVFAARTVNEVAIFSCKKESEHELVIERNFDLPLLSPNMTLTGSLADITFDPTGSRIAVITTQGHWIVYECDPRQSLPTILSLGAIGGPSVENEQGLGGWKILWTNDPNTVIISENQSIHLLDVDVGKSSIVFKADRKEGFWELASLEGLGGTAIAVLTSSEILIIDIITWQVRLRQKHRRDVDTSLMIKPVSLEDGMLHINVW
jgi:hypothetical protein